MATKMINIEETGSTNYHGAAACAREMGTQEIIESGKEFFKYILQVRTQGTKCLCLNDFIHQSTRYSRRRG